jgi:hypothetical protein
METKRLEELETLVREREIAFVDQGNALVELRDSKIYQVRNEPNFENYCRTQFGMSKRRVWQLISAAKAYRILKDNEFTRLPVNESQLRPLTKLNDDTIKLIRVWSEVLRAAGDGPLTAGIVTASIRRLYGQTTEKRQTPSSAFKRLRKAWNSATIEERHRFTLEVDLVTTSAPQTPWEVLGLEQGATLAEINAGYRRLSDACHPDRFEQLPTWLRDAATENMKRINRAVEELRRKAAA